jgi:uncharacterized membrane protein YesL
VGIPKDEPKKKGIVRFFQLYFRKFWKIIQVNMLFFCAFIPLILGFFAFVYMSNANLKLAVVIICIIGFLLLIGPATASMMKILRNYSLEKHSFILTDFKKCFSENYKKSVAVGIIDTALIISLSAAMYVYPKLAQAYDNKMIWIPFIICISIGIMAVMMNFYAFLMIIATDISFKNIVKNSFALAFVEIKKNFLTLIITTAIIVGYGLLIFWNLSFLFLLPFFPGSFIGFIVCFNSYPVIQKYVINPYYEQRGEVNPELDESDDDEETIFQDMGGKEKPVVAKKTKKGKTIS